MKSPIATTALALALGAPAFAQGPAPGPAADPTRDVGTLKAPADLKVFPAASVLPEPVKSADIQQPTIPLPTEPLEPYLLTKEAGPFMVLAHTFRGKDAARYAQALAMELRQDYQLPAWVYYMRINPMNSRIRGIPPTAPNYLDRPEMTPPEVYRIYDEAAVLVGNCKTEAEATKLLHQVKKLYPKCLGGLPSLWDHRKGKGLSRALRTTNPLVPAQYLYPKRIDPLIKQMNGGPHSIFKCPGQYTLQVAEFTGRSEFKVGEAKVVAESLFRGSPLAHAAEDAEKLAAALAADPEVQRTGFRPYTYHDRYGSKVAVGAFNLPEDPKDDPKNPRPRSTTEDPQAESLRQTLLRLAVPLSDKKKAGLMIVPAPVLMKVPAQP